MNNTHQMAEARRIYMEEAAVEERTSRRCSTIEDVYIFYPWYLRVIFYLSGNIPLSEPSLFYKIRFWVQLLVANIVKATIFLIYRGHDLHRVIYVVLFAACHIVMNGILLFYARRIFEIVFTIVHVVKPPKKRLRLGRLFSLDSLLSWFLHLTRACFNHPTNL
ncbi:hypothetical protein LAZ67_12000581 [Cordylochernes scorpioides]|uniref:Uncharacterized protein n=1 Tax=Cordylochernes scorpioides TaxID=51811 RepID=A0ABY6L143_9ARAC|nr:hypothetical protein LAZ67_12000581 [Cordylochernes scorpioides]